MGREERAELSAMMARLADGDRDAFALVFGRLWPALHAFARRVLGSDADADDVAQRALLSIMARASEYDRDRDALAWAIGITAWECRTLRRRHARRRETTMPEALRLSTASPEDAVIERDLLRAVEHAIGELTPDDRAALGLGPAIDDAPAATIRKRRQRALTRLRAAWSRLHAR